MNLTKQENSLSHIKSQVAKLLLGNAGKSDSGKQPMTHREMATMLDTDWGLIHLSLKSLCGDGLIRIERNRIIITRELVEQAAVSA